eukprot:sb/3469221/
MCRTVHPGYVPTHDPEYEEIMTKITNFKLHHTGPLSPDNRISNPFTELCHTCLTGGPLCGLRTIMPTVNNAYVEHDLGNPIKSFRQYETRFVDGFYPRALYPYGRCPPPPWQKFESGLGAPIFRGTLTFSEERKHGGFWGCGFWGCGLLQRLEELSYLIHYANRLDRIPGYMICNGRCPPFSLGECEREMAPPNRVRYLVSSPTANKLPLITWFTFRTEGRQNYNVLALSSTSVVK